MLLLFSLSGSAGAGDSYGGSWAAGHQRVRVGERRMNTISWVLHVQGPWPAVIDDVALAELWTMAGCHRRCCVS
uniref:Uncharacterized protein n=1 Tax=Setaria italica TaxID=4555 RepID=K3ZMH2_SETIT